jgi:hypothetical protein
LLHYLISYLFLCSHGINSNNVAFDINEFQ